MERDDLTRLFCRCCTLTPSSHECTVVDVTAARLDSTRPTSPPRTSIQLFAQTSSMLHGRRLRSLAHQRTPLSSDRHGKHPTHAELDPRSHHSRTTSRPRCHEQSSNRTSRRLVHKHCNSTLQADDDTTQKTVLQLSPNASTILAANDSTSNRPTIIILTIDT
jgi:hypothetical protein